MYITTYKRNEVIAELQKGEKTQAEIAETVGISASSVYKISCQIGKSLTKVEKSKEPVSNYVGHVLKLMVGVTGVLALNPWMAGRQNQLS